MLLIFLLLSVFQSAIGINKTPNLVVQTEYGKVRGITDYTMYDNRTFYSFRGIPYAKPPVGKLRFKVL